MMEPKFIPNATRWRGYDRLKHAIKQGSPAWFVAAVIGALRPLVSAREELRFRARLRRLLPRKLAARFPAMYRDARARWHAGQTTQTHAPMEFRILGTDHAVFLRPGTTDIILFRDIFIRKQYGHAPISDVRTIVDCGANVGLASVFLLLQFPQARVIAVEPDPINYELCRKNLASFGARAVVVNAAVWAQPRTVVVDERNRGTWAAQVREAESTANEGAVPGYPLHELFDRFDATTVDILKMDIEGAEKPIFSAEDLSWLDRVRCIQIELEAGSRETFFRALHNRGFRYTQHTEATIAYRDDAQR